MRQFIGGAALILLGFALNQLASKVDSRWGALAAFAAAMLGLGLLASSATVRSFLRWGADGKAVNAVTVVLVAGLLGFLAFALLAWMAMALLRTSSPREMGPPPSEAPLAAVKKPLPDLDIRFGERTSESTWASLLPVHYKNNETVHTSLNVHIDSLTLVNNTRRKTKILRAWLEIEGAEQLGELEPPKLAPAHKTIIPSSEDRTFEFSGVVTYRGDLRQDRLAGRIMLKVEATGVGVVPAELPAWLFQPLSVRAPHSYEDDERA